MTEITITAEDFADITSAFTNPTTVNKWARHQTRTTTNYEVSGNLVDSILLLAMADAAWHHVHYPFTIVDKLVNATAVMAASILNQRCASITFGQPDPAYDDLITESKRIAAIWGEAIVRVKEAE